MISPDAPMVEVIAWFENLLKQYNQEVDMEKQEKLLQDIEKAILRYMLHYDVRIVNALEERHIPIDVTSLLP
jgi:hypothetical protein